jgi:hypothetical protein
MTLEEILDGFTWAIGSGLVLGLLSAVVYNVIYKGR